jgi:hypothetical protein
MFFIPHSNGFGQQLQPRTNTGSKVNGGEQIAAFNRLRNRQRMYEYCHQSLAFIESLVSVLASIPLDSLVSPDVMAVHPTQSSIVLGSNTAPQLCRIDFDRTAFVISFIHVDVKIVETH